MSKLLSTLIAAAFAVTTFGAVAQTPPAKGDAPKATPAQPSDKAKTQKKAKADKPKADKPKTEKKAKSDKPKSSTKSDGKKTKGDGKKSEKAAAPKQEETKK